MDWLQVVVLAFVQGLTEFLPISSSAHLILVPELLGWPDQGLAFDVTLHLGSLIAVLLYFRADLSRLFFAWSGSLRTHQYNDDARLAWGLIFGVIPVGLFGFLLKDYVEIYLRSPMVIASTTIIFGLLLWLADRRKNNTRPLQQLTWRDVAVIGFMQVLALIPGTSRSGITITAGLLQGLTREAASRFSFLLAIPVILMSGGKTTLDLAQSNLPIHWGMFLVGAALSALSAYLCIHYFLKLIARVGMLPFVIYRLALGLFLFAII